MNHPLTIWIGAIVSLAVFSYLAKDNPFYRIVQQAALGVMVGVGVVVTWRQVLQPMWLTPIRQSLAGAPGAEWGWLWVGAAVPGAMWYFQLSKRYFWVSTLVSAMFIGIAAGLAFKNEILLIMPQIRASLKPVNPFAGPEGFTWAGLGQSVSNLVFLAALLTTLLYFFFSIRTDNRLLRPPVRVGRLMLMIALGAMFGNTVMTRMAYLIERLNFLFHDWLDGLVYQQWLRPWLSG